MNIDANNLKFYAAAAATGGEIDGSHLQTSSTLGNEIGTILKAERESGTIKYVKQFLKNENADQWGPVKVYLSSLPKYMPDTVLAFTLAGSKSRSDTSVELSGTATFTATTLITTSTDLTGEVMAGESVFNSTDDAVSKCVPVLEVATTHIILASPYAGTTGSDKTISVAPATMFQYIAPTTVDDTLSPTVTVVAGGFVGTWKRYEVKENCPPFSNDSFSIMYEEI
jgi:hypothetical protein